MEVRIRKATSRDLPEIVRLETECFPDPWSVESVSSALQSAKGVFWVAESSEERLVAYLIASRVLDEAEIDRIGVEPESRRWGLGRRLLRHALENLVCCGVGVAWLEVRRSNLAARELYETEGFEVVSVRRNYYAGSIPDDALILSKKLSRPPELPSGE